MAAIKTAAVNYCTNFWSKENAKKKFPISTWLPQYRCKHLTGDIIAGLTVGLTVIPQGLAYAIVAELPPQYGLYSAFMGCFIYTIFGTSKDITLGPTAIMSLMTAEFSHRNPIRGDPTYAIILCLLSGVIQFVMGMLHLGFIVQFISYPVINAFTSAAAIIIATGQIKKWLGLAIGTMSWPNMIYRTFAQIPETNLMDFGMGLACIIALVGMKFLKEFSDIQMKKKGAGWSTGYKIANRTVWLLCTARNAVVVMVTATIAFILISNDIDGLSLTKEVSPGLPGFSVPKFSVTNSSGYLLEEAGQVFSNLGAGIAVIPLIGLLESIAIAKAFSRFNDYQIDSNQELIAMGVANLVSCFFGSYPVTGSFSRTAINSQSGVRTPMGGVFTGLLVLLALQFLTPFFQYIPQAALAAVIMTAVVQMVDYRIVLTLWRVKPIDLVPWALTFLFCFPWGLEYGILLGVGVNILLLLYPEARPKITKGYEKSSDYLSLNAEDVGEGKMAEVAVMETDKGLNFPGIEYLKDKVMKEAIVPGGNNRSVVLNCQHITSVDYTTIAGITQLCEYFKKRHLYIVYTNISDEVLAVIKSATIEGFVYADTQEEGIRRAFGLGSSHEMLGNEDGESVKYIEGPSPLSYGSIKPSKSSKPLSDDDDVRTTDESPKRNGGFVLGGNDADVQDTVETSVPTMVAPSGDEAVEATDGVSNEGSNEAASNEAPSNDTAFREESELPTSASVTKLL